MYSRLKEIYGPENLRHGKCTSTTHVCKPDPNPSEQEFRVVELKILDLVHDLAGSVWAGDPNPNLVDLRIADDIYHRMLLARREACPSKT